MAGTAKSLGDPERYARVTDTSLKSGQVTVQAKLRVSRRADQQDLFQAGVDEFFSGLQNWRVAHLMGLGEIRRRYARSKLGQFWLSLSSGIMVVALGVVWSVLWKVPLADLLPFFAISQLVWQLITGTLAEAATVFVASGPLFLNQGMSFSTAIYGLIYKHILILLHNTPIILLALLIFDVGAGPTALLAIPGVILLLASLLWLSFIIAIACVRYRDLVHVVQSGLMMAFFITPVLWKPTQIPPDKAYFLLLNPFASLLSVVREPLLGQVPSASVWIAALLTAVIGFFLALPVIGFCRLRLIYWI
jgi:ABC-type polysaccharide/polyol phosphate export permease